MIEHEIVAWVEMEAEAKKLRRQASWLLAGDQDTALKAAEEAAAVQIEADRLRDHIVRKLGEQ